MSTQRWGDLRLGEQLAVVGTLALIPVFGFVVYVAANTPSDAEVSMSHTVARMSGLSREDWCKDAHRLSFEDVARKLGTEPLAIAQAVRGCKG